MLSLCERSSTFPYFAWIVFGSFYFYFTLKKKNMYVWVMIFLSVDYVGKPHRLFSIHIGMILFTLGLSPYGFVFGLLFQKT